MPDMILIGKTISFPYGKEMHIGGIYMPLFAKAVFRCYLHARGCPSILKVLEILRQNENRYVRAHTCARLN